jgi:type I restriction-modification system DNA methylase subunit
MKQATNPHQLNLEIEALVARKDADREGYSEAEKEFILRYSGAGGKGGAGAKGEGLLYEYYTPEYIVEYMWRIAAALGYDGGAVLEPAAGTGVFAKLAPDPSKVVGFEPNPVSRRIAEITCPQATFHAGYFETAFMDRPRLTSRLKGNATWLQGHPFSLVIGNPPYGTHKNLYSGFFKAEAMPSMETFFIHQGLALLRPGGLLAYVVPSGFLRNGQSYDRAKERIGRMADLLHAFRLPSVFDGSNIPTDIIILKRK